MTVLKGMPKTLAANMDESLTVPTATSVRTVAPTEPVVTEGSACASSVSDCLAHSV